MGKALNPAPAGTGRQAVIYLGFLAPDRVLGGVSLPGKKPRNFID